MGDSNFAGNFLHIKMNCDATLEVLRNSPMTLHSRFTLAMASFSAVMLLRKNLSLCNRRKDQADDYQTCQLGIKGVC